MEGDEQAPTGERSKHLHVHGRVEARDLMTDMVEKAQRKISVIGPTLDAYLFNTPRVAQALASFAAAHRKNLARFLVVDVDQSINRNGRIVELCRRFSDFIKMRQVNEHDIGLQEMFLVIDDSAYVHQPHTDRPDYLARLDARGEARQLTIRYERLWERSLTISTIDPAGL